MADDRNEGIPASVDPVLLRYCTWQGLQAIEDDEVRTAVRAALERGDASVYELDDGWVGVKVMGQRWLRNHRSRLRWPAAN